MIGMLPVCQRVQRIALNPNTIPNPNTSATGTISQNLDVENLVTVRPPTDVECDKQATVVGLSFTTLSEGRRGQVLSTVTDYRRPSPVDHSQRTA